MKIRCHVSVKAGSSFAHEFNHRPVRGDFVIYEKVVYEVQAFVHNMDDPSKLPFVVLKKAILPTS